MVSGLALRYYGAMLSSAAVAAVFASAAAAAADQWASLADLLGRVAVFLVGANLAGAAAMFAPIKRFLAGDKARRDRAARRIGALPGLSGLWIAGLAACAMLGHAAAVYGSWAILLQSPRGALLGTLVHIGVFAAYLGLYGYFLTIDYTIGLRNWLWEQGEPLPPRRGKLVHRLIVAFVAVAAAPILIIVSDQWLHPVGADIPMGMAVPRYEGHIRQTLQMDVLAALLLTGMVIWLISRGVSRPVDILLDAMRRVDRGDLRTKAPVVSDDELGLLARQFNGMLAGLRERDRIRRTFARFVPESVAAALIADEGAITPQEREATVLFADIERFTEIASRLAPREIVQMLNDYFDEIARVIHGKSGVITQFQGDAVLATFNLPAADPRHAQHALEVAIEIGARLHHATFASGIRLQARIGISTGRVVGGTVGGGERLGYTVHGDTVNLAARLEALNRELGTRILVSARTAELLDGSVPLSDRGAVDVRGFGAPVRVFAPITENSAVPKSHGFPK